MKFKHLSNFLVSVSINAFTLCKLLLNTLVLWALNFKFHFLIFPQGRATLLTTFIYLGSVFDWNFKKNKKVKSSTFR